MVTRCTALLACSFAALMAASCSPGTAERATPTPSATASPVSLGPASTSEPSPSPRPPSDPTATPFLLPLPGPDDWALGPPGAPAEFLIYSDLQSPNAALGLQSLLDVFDRHPDEVRLVFRHFPVVSQYDKDSLAGQAVEAAGRQGAFWPMVRLLTDRHAEWSVLPPESFAGWVQEQASTADLDPLALMDDLASGRYTGLMVQAFQEATALGIPGVPTILLNGAPLRVAPTPLDLESATRLAILAAHQFPGAPEMTIDPEVGYTATLETSEGDVVIQLFPRSAPNAVNSFVFLAEQGWYDGGSFFYVEPGVLVEAGDPSETGLGDPGYHLPDEIDPSLDLGAPGMVALSSAGPGTNGSRFFINLESLPSLTGTRTIFGRVIDGLEVLGSLESRHAATDLLSPGAGIIRRVRIERTP